MGVGSLDTTFLRYAAVAVLLALLVPEASAQTTRTEEIEQARRDKTWIPPPGIAEDPVQYDRWGAFAAVDYLEAHDDRDELPHEPFS